MSEYIVRMPPDMSYELKAELNAWYVNSEPIVRCRDCAYICNRRYTNGLELYTCSYFDSEHAEVVPDGFCAWGERRQA